MFLKIVRARARQLHSDDSGVAMAMVIALMVVSVIICVLIVASVVTAFGFSTASRANVQAEAAAQAGIAVAVASVQNGTSCSSAGGVYTSTTAPIYRATVWIPNAAGGWIQGCPVTSTPRIRVISTGTAASPAINGQSANNVAYVESVFNTGTPSNTGAIYAYNGTSGNAIQMSVTGSGSNLGGIVSPNGGITCGAGTIQGGLYTFNLNTLNGTCNVTGGIQSTIGTYIYGKATITGDVTGTFLGMYTDSSGKAGTITGNVYANNLADISGQINGNVTSLAAMNVQNSARITGNVLTTGPLLMLGGTVGGSATVTTDNSYYNSPDTVNRGNVVTWSGTPVIGGNLVVKTYLSATGSGAPAYGTAASTVATYLKSKAAVTGTVTVNATTTSPTAASIPAQPTWTNWTFEKSVWQAAGFAQQLTWPSSLGCTVDSNAVTNTAAPLYSFIQQLKSISIPTVVDATGCSTGGLVVASGAGLALNINADLAFVGQQFNLTGLTMNSSSSTVRKAYFLVPDGAPATAGPDCTNGSGSVTLAGTAMIGANLSALVYTPCTINDNAAVAWRGQFYSGYFANTTADNLNYVPMNIPGTTLNTVTSGVASATYGGLVYTRDRQNNGE